jgi:hypothetical protein
MKEKTVKTRLIPLAASILTLACMALIATPSFAVSPSSGATLQADKTIEICDNGNGTWHYSGAISVWNTGSADAVACQINDKIESKNVSGPNWTSVCQALSNASCGDLGAIVPGGTLEDSAFVTTYSCDAAPQTTSVRNNANITIANHSGGRANGPNPKATYFGTVPPPACGGDCGCALTQGYWKNHPEDPAWATADLSLFGGAANAMTILQTNPQFGNAWLILAHQYIAYLLDVGRAGGSCTPPGLGDLVTRVRAFFIAHPYSTYATDCTKSNGWCGSSTADACILDAYNNGIYPGGPSHCGEESDNVLECATTP